MVRALTRDASGRYHYRSGDGKGQFAKKADIEAFRAVQASNGRAGAAKTNALRGRYAKAIQTIGANPRGPGVGEAKRRMQEWLEDVYDAQAEDEALPAFPEFYT